MFIPIYFASVALIVAYIDIRDGLILDKIMFPALFLLLLLKYFEQTLLWSDFVAVAIVLVVFLVPIFFNMAFGGGDLRFGALCALFLGLEPLGFFILFAGGVHLLLLLLLRKESFAFAPAMSIAALSAYFTGSL